MTTLSIGGTEYRLLASEREGQWIAHARRTDNGDRFGAECVGASASEAIARLRCWIEWQSEHAAALEDLQRVERAYHRTVAGSAFAYPSEGPTAIELQRESLEAVDAARTRLDEIRARKPE